MFNFFCILANLSLTVKYIDIDIRSRNFFFSPKSLPLFSNNILQLSWEAINIAYSFIRLLRWKKVEQIVSYVDTSLVKSFPLKLIRMCRISSTGTSAGKKNFFCYRWFQTVFLLMVTLYNFRYGFPVFMDFLCDMVKFDHNLQRMMSYGKHLDLLM